jgi:hypothetical protein
MGFMASSLVRNLPRPYSFVALGFFLGFFTCLLLMMMTGNFRR